MFLVFSSGLFAMRLPLNVEKVNTAFTSILGIFAPVQVNVLTAHSPVETVVSPSNGLAPNPSIVIVIRFAAHVLQADKERKMFPNHLRKSFV